MKYFASENAEIVAFADEKQNIYSRELDNEKCREYLYKQVLGIGN